MGQLLQNETFLTKSQRDAIDVTFDSLSKASVQPIRISRKILSGPWVSLLTGGNLQLAVVFRQFGFGGK